MEENKGRIVELGLLFVLIPILLALSIDPWIKGFAVILGVGYVAYQYITEKIYKGAFAISRPSRSYILRVSIVSALLLIGGIVFLKIYDETLLFSVVKTKPLMWVIILFVYAFLSVVPQELVYRRFFYERYQGLFGNKTFFFLVNVFCFALCHLFLLNGVVLVLTALGGCLFAFTYQREESLIWTSVEHAIYGNIIFTLGVGEMLAFPV